MSKKNKQKYIQAPTTDDLERMKSGEKFSDITAGPIKKALDNDLKETIDNFDESEITSDTSKNNVKIRRGIYFSLSIFVTIMSIIGIFFTINFFVGIVKNIADNTSQKKELERYIYPAVVVDIPTFKEGESVPVEVMLSTAAWDIIINGDTSNYEDSFGYLTVPASDLEVHATKIFGAGHKFGHQTLGSGDLTFEYIEATNSYVIPQSPHYLTYSAKVEDIKKLSEKKFELKVGYYPPAKIWFPDDKKVAEADKYMKYTVVQKGNNNYTIVSVDYYYKTDQPIS